MASQVYPKSTRLTEAHPTKCLGSLVAVNQKGAQVVTQESLDATS